MLLNIIENLPCANSNECLHKKKKNTFSHNFYSSNIVRSHTDKQKAVSLQLDSSLTFGNFGLSKICRHAHSLTSWPNQRRP